MKLELYSIIRTPIITEKTTQMQSSANKVVFQVALKANKREIKEAVEKIFKVEVQDVRTMRFQGKMRRMGRHEGRRPDWKKAIVTLKEGQTIDFLGGV